MPATFPTPFLRLAAAAVIVTACATAPTARFATRSAPASPFLLTAAEISRVHVNSAYEAVQRLKPNFLTGMRGQSDFATRAVYLNGARLIGGIENLRMIEAITVLQIVFLNSSEATARYGAGNSAGAILVFTAAPGSSMSEGYSR